MLLYYISEQTVPSFTRGTSHAKLYGVYTLGVNAATLRSRVFHGWLKPQQHEVSLKPALFVFVSVGIAWIEDGG